MPNVISPYHWSDGALVMDYPVEYDWDNLPKELVVAVLRTTRISGFIAYRFIPHRILEIAKLAVLDKRRKYGSELIHYAVTRARITSATSLRMVLPEDNLIGCLFLKYCGFEGSVYAQCRQFIQFDRCVL